MARGDVSVLRGKGDGTFRAGVSLAAGSFPSEVAVANLDGDTLPDLVTANAGGDNVTVFLGDADGSFPVVAVPCGLGFELLLMLPPLLWLYRRRLN